MATSSRIGRAIPTSTKTYTGDEDSQHPQWVMIDLGAKVEINAIRIAWADPYAKRYYVQFWTGEQAAVLQRHQQGLLADLSHGRHRGRQGRHADPEADESDTTRALPSHLDDGVVEHLRYARRAGQAQLRGIRDQRTVRGYHLGRRPVQGCRQAPAQPAADHHVAIVGGPVARRVRPRLRKGRSDRVGLLLHLRRDARACPP